MEARRVYTFRGAWDWQGTEQKKRLPEGTESERQGVPAN